MDLVVEKASKHFPGVRALDAASLSARGGEIHALLGENGAGKSTLIKIVTGLHAPDSGRILLNGRSVAFNSPRDALSAGVSVVHQERNLIPRFTVGENILLERLPVRRGLIDYGAVNREAIKHLAPLDSSIDPRAEVRNLSVAQRQIVEIAKALSLEAKVLLLDEPTASISEHETAALFRLLRQLRAHGVAIVFVSHKLEEVFAIADRMTVLRDGKNVATDVPASEISRGRLVSLMIGREERTAELGERRGVRSEVVLEARGLSSSFGHRDVSFALRRGEILGFYGLVGAGRTELAQTLVGAGRILQGELLLRGRRVRIRTMNEALTKHRIGFVSEDRKREGLILTHSIKRNVALTIWPRLARFAGFIDPRREASAVEPLVKRLDIRARSIDQPVVNLSGGNQQKVSIAKWLAANVDILIVDEPTVGIDVKTKVYIHELIGQIARDGVSVMLISSDLPEMVALADRILVMHGFRLIGEVANDHVYETASQAVMARIHALDDSEQGPAR